MGRIRTIKPEFWSDEKVGELKRDERLLFIGLLNLADDEGVLKATPAFIKGQIFAYDEDLTISDVRSWLDGLIIAKMLLPFEHNSERFFLIRTFGDHQKINRPTPSKIPKNVLVNTLNAYSMHTHGILNELSLPEGKGKEGNREWKGREGEDTPPIFEKDLSDKILLFFGFNEIANYDKLRDVSAFLKCLEIGDKISYFKDQFSAYIEFKKINDSFLHSFKNFLGSQDELFINGAWNSENWIHKLELEKNKILQNGKKNERNGSGVSDIKRLDGRQPFTRL